VQEKDASLDEQIGSETDSAGNGSADDNESGSDSDYDME
jgi:hypothetical protein